MAPQTFGRVPAMLNFCRPGQRAGGMGCAGQDRADLEGASSRRASSKARRRHLRQAERSSTLRMSARHRFARQVPASCRHPRRACARKADDPAVNPVHIRLGRHAQGRRALPSQHPGQAAQALARVDANANDKVFNVLPVFHSFGLTGGMMMPLLGRHSDLHLSLAAALPDRAGTDLPDRRHHPVRHRYVPHRLRPLGPCL